MDAWDEEFREPTEDERTARRVLALAIALINARKPIATNDIRRELYADLREDSFRRAFLRDRNHLAKAGLEIRRGPDLADSYTWEVNPEVSFAKEGVLTKEDALELDVLLLPLASDPSYPYARDLRLALAKIDRSFDGSSSVIIPPSARRRNNNITRLEECMTTHHGARMVYERADGTRTDRMVAPLGFFYLNGRTYMVASHMVDGELAEPHTYNLDRVVSVRENPKASFMRPLDFDVRDYVLLPFQIGEVLYEATFRSNCGSTRTETVCDESMAASWAIAEGVVPTYPPSLVEEWTRQLKAAGDAHHD